MVDQAGFLDPLRVESIDPINWKLLDRFRWQGSKGDIFEVNKGAITDFATVPWWTQAILPRTGTWTKAAVVHDKMCDLQEQFYVLMQQYELAETAWLVDWHPDGHGTKPVKPTPPTFSSIDADAIFRKNSLAEGTDPFRSELLWFGVRTGSLFNPARRNNWMATFPRYFADLFVILAVLIGLIALVVMI